MGLGLIGDLLGLGDFSWKDRVRDNIFLTSPNFQIFSAFWQGSPRTMSKKLGVFEYPNIKGAFVQDLDVGAERYPMSIFFEGNGHDLDAGRFFRACKERGTWLVIHPVHGPLELQLVEVEEIDDPVNSGNITQFNLQWIESITIEALITLTQIANFIGTLAAELNLIAGLLFGRNVNQGNAAFIQAIRNATNVAAVAVDRSLQSVYIQDADVTAFVAAAQRDIENIIAQPEISTEDLAGGFQNLIQTSLTTNEEMQSRLNAVNVLVDSLILTAPTEPTIEALNFSATLEMLLVANIAAAAQIVSTSELFSRKESLNSLDLFLNIFTKVVNALDILQTLFENNSIENQYFSMLESYPDMAKLVGQASNYLLKQSFDLAVERRFTTTRPRSPVELVVTEYGELGDNDSNLDLFIDTNKLKGNDIILLPAGFQVVVYA